MSDKIGIYPGTFDPITNGHADIILRASKIVDKLYLAISTSHNKSPIFDIKTRMEMAKIYIDYLGLRNVEVTSFSGLLVDHMKNYSVDIVIRGLRAVSDFEYEFQMACMNSRLDTNMETIFLPASEKNQFISSRLVKEIASLGGDISEFVLPEVKDRLALYYCQKS